jgi:hypothetical protein
MVYNLTLIHVFTQEAEQYNTLENMLRIMREKDTFLLGKNKRNHQKKYVTFPHFSLLGCHRKIINLFPGENLVKVREKSHFPMFFSVKK